MGEKESIAKILDSELEKRSFITGMEMSAEKLFQPEEVKNWIRRLLENDKASELVERIESTSTERLAHAASTYLLGIAIREDLDLNFDFLPRIFSKGSFGDAFYFFWSVICLCHDLGYEYERKEYDLNLMDTHEGRCALLDIHYDMFELDRNICHLDGTAEEKEWILRTLDLAKKYDRKLRSADEDTGKGPRIDHGIAGALILYDALMKEHHRTVSKKNLSKAENYRDPRAMAEQEVLSGEVSSNVYNNRFVVCTILIACTVARHNMWSASAKSVERYRKFGLNFLCPGGEGTIISVEKPLDQMLFLLDFMDTIDPVKGLYTREAETGSDSQRLDNQRNLLLNGVEIESKKKGYHQYRWESVLEYQEVTIGIVQTEKDENKKCFSEYTNNLKGLNGWLKTKSPKLQVDEKGRISGITFYYPNVFKKQRQWAGGITENEITALCLYQGSGGNGKAGAFYQYHNAYQTLNLLMMDGLEGEEVRICTEKQNPHGLYIREWKKTLEVMTDIFMAQCKYMEYWSKEKKVRPVIYRVDRKVNFDMMQEQKRTFAFTSTSKKGYLANLAKAKKDLILQEIVLTGDVYVPFIDYAELLQDMYVYSEEQEVLLPPFLEVCGVEGPLKLSLEEQKEITTDQGGEIQKYVVKLGAFEVGDEQEDELALIERLEKYKDVAAKVLEEMKERRMTTLDAEQTRHYLEWKKDFQRLVRHCFFIIGAAYGLAKR